MIPLSPDGRAYLRAAMGQPVPRPYSRRWLLPFLLGPHPARWALATYASLALTPFAAWAYFAAMGLDGARLVFAVALLCALPGVWRCSLRFPVLIDAPSFALSLLLATNARHCMAGQASWLVLVPFLLAGGAMRETIPVFAALWAWSPLPLVGLLAVGWWRKAAPPDAPWLEHPIREALKLRRDIGLDGTLYLRPFGAALAGLVHPTAQTIATVAVAHLQLAAAQDTIRLTVWCAPVLVLHAAQVVPLELAPLAVLWTVMQEDRRV